MRLATFDLHALTALDAFAMIDTSTTVNLT